MQYRVYHQRPLMYGQLKHIETRQFYVHFNEATWCVQIQ